MSFLLHAHAEGSIFKTLSNVLLDGILDTLMIIPFLFLTYLLMEFIEHNAASRARRFMEKAGVAGPAIGGIIGAIPQCGFSAAGANLYTGRVITAGTLISVFLSTSDEMLPILISGSVSPTAILTIIAYKAAVGIAVGFAVDIVLRLVRRGERPMCISEMCDDDGCRCEGGIFRSALHHTLTVGGFVFAVTVLSGALVSFVGTERISAIMYGKPVVSHIIAAIFGMIPNCAASVLLTNFCLSGFITVGTMMSGLFSGAGVGLLMLFRSNKRRMRENIAIALTVLISGILFGFLADVLNFSIIP